ncbi:hypothetical protein [Amphritea sp.]|uniref:hypothetical protein n=1 Tax=Amphritea sp. TaxID=1872502 RepID=UPI00356658BF
MKLRKNLFIAIIILLLTPLNAYAVCGMDPSFQTNNALMSQVKRSELASLHLKQSKILFDEIPRLHYTLRVLHKKSRAFLYLAFGQKRHRGFAFQKISARP